MTNTKKPGGNRAVQNSLSVKTTQHTTTGPADVHALLQRLEKVKQTRSDAWKACCPAHDDRSPSLSVRLVDEGKILLKCWSGCSASDIVATLGMELSDLFPRREHDTWSKPVSPGQRWIPRDVLSALVSEALIVLLAAEEVHQGNALSDADLDRLSLAIGRLRNGAREVGCYE
nr:CHC2 zinc finger domain-containing protein [uncultured Halomonas sp.]